VCVVVDERVCVQHRKAVCSPWFSALLGAAPAARSTLTWLFACTGPGPWLPGLSCTGWHPGGLSVGCEGWVGLGCVVCRGEGGPSTAPARQPTGTPRCSGRMDGRVAIFSSPIPAPAARMKVALCRWVWRMEQGGWTLQLQLQGRLARARGKARPWQAHHRIFAHPPRVPM